MENAIHLVCCVFAAFGSAHGKEGQVTWLKLQAIKTLTSKDFSCFKEQQVISLFSISFMLPLLPFAEFLLSSYCQMADICTISVCLVLLYKNTGILKKNGSLGGTQISCSSLQ